MDAAQLRPLGVGEVLDAAIKIYRTRFMTLVKAVVLVVVPVRVLAFLVQLSLPVRTTTTTFGPGAGSTVTSTTTSSSSGATLAAVLLILAVTILGSALAEAASLRIVSDAYLGTESDWRSSLRFGFERLGSVLWLTLLRALGLVLGFIACIAPGVWLYAAWSVAVPALLIEGTRGTRALSRSQALVKGRWGPTAGALFLAYLLTSIATGAFTAVALPLFIANPSSTTALAVSALAGAVAGVLTTPFAAAVAAVIYFDLRVRKEGFDLELMAQRIGAAPPSAGARPPEMPWTPRPGAAPPPGWGQTPAPIPPPWTPPPPAPPAPPPPHSPLPDAPPPPPHSPLPDAPPPPPSPPGPPRPWEPPV